MITKAPGNAVGVGQMEVVKNTMEAIAAEKGIALTEVTFGMLPVDMQKILENIFDLCNA